MAGIERVGNVFYRVQDLHAAVQFYRDVLGLSLKFQDGERWAAFDVGGMTLALEGGSAEGGPGHGATVSLRVSGLDDLAPSLRARGARISEITDGPHERRATVTDPAGNQLVLYEPRPPQQPS